MARYPSGFIVDTNEYHKWYSMNFLIILFVSNQFCAQIWASNFLPNEVHKKDQNQLKYYQKHKTRLLNDYLTKELIAKERVILQNNDFVVLVPYWAYWPYETIVLPSKRNVKRLYELTESEKHSLADILKRLLAKYDNLFECSFPYASGWIGKCLANY